MIKTSLLVLALTLILSGCQSTSKSEDTNKESLNQQKDTLSLAQLFENVAQFENEEITVKGLCVHTCRHSGKRLFIQGNTEEEFLLVTASGDISKFDNNIEGSEISVTGRLKSTPPPQEKQNNHDDGETCANESKAKDYKLECVKYRKAD